MSKCCSLGVKQFPCVLWLTWHLLPHFMFFSLTRLFPCLRISLFSLASLWTLAGLPARSWLSLEKPLCTKKSLLGRKENQNKKRMPRAYGQRNVARGIPAGLWPHVSLVTVPLQVCISPLQDEAALLLQAAGTRKLGEALQRTGKWFSLLVAESDLMGPLFFCHAQLLQKLHLFLNFLLFLFSLHSLSFLLKQSKHTKSAQSVQVLHNLPDLADFAETLVLSSEVIVHLRSTFAHRLAQRSVVYTQDSYNDRSCQSRGFLF